MLVPHIYLYGHCKEAIQLYQKAFGATVHTIIEDDEHRLIIHAEIEIHNQLLMLNDTGGDLDFSRSGGGYQLSVQFDNEDDLAATYSILVEGAAIILSMQATEYSVCVVRFIDQFDVRWALWV